MHTLYQPILSKIPEPSHLPKDALSLRAFIELLKEEEDYYPGEQNNTKLMITRLRKIFYDQWGWNDELIKGARDIDSRYDVLIVDNGTQHTKEIKRYKKYRYEPKHRKVVYRSNDRVYGDTRAGQPTFIYSNDHQEVLLPDGYYCDIAHILAGIDASNHPQIVTPLPNFLLSIAKLFPYVKFNMDMATWLGDLGSGSGDFFFDYLLNNKKPLTTEKEQEYININAPGSDMLGNVDTYAINQSYDVKTSKGMRFTEILEDYYFNETSPKRFRFSLFCNGLGLKNWDGNNFGNEKEWLKFYTKQLKNETTFQIFSVTDEKLDSLWLPLVAWLGLYKKVLKTEELLILLIKALKELIKQEPKNAKS